jgi:hypothetical protein
MGIKLAKAGLGTAATLLSALALHAPPAFAFVNNWGCNSTGSGQICYSTAGYHSYLEVTAVLQYARPEVCTKGITAAGNIRTGSGCNYNFVNYRTSCFAGGTPNSLAYYYWGGGYPNQGGSAIARTSSDRFYC